MCLLKSAVDERFRSEIRAFLRDHLPADLAARGRMEFHPRRSEVERWTRILAQRGWVAPHWPVEYGGTGWTPMERFIFEEELRAAHAPVLDRPALELVGPVIYTFGSTAQKKRYLPKILNGEEFWCQGFSEPGAGSDLASLRTKAVLSGDHYVVTGHKIWTSEAHRADLIFALVRTDPEAKPQAGISFLLAELQSPGITVRPIYTMDEGFSINEVFFNEVRVPRENIVGEVNKGWTYAKFLLANERTVSAEVPHTKSDLDQLKQVAALERRKGRPLIEDPPFRSKLARLEIDLLALEYAVLRVLAAPKPAEANAVASVLKLRGAELRQRVAELMANALGCYGVAVYSDPASIEASISQSTPPIPDYAIGIVARAMWRRAATIYGGTNEIQRNVIAKSILGL
jgi:acyl-CoA dehydrogenase